ncbi:hypothetical protein C8Q78DRAFT_1074585 [Trametes maxima]|nr:hypothetical protein C8Q78DRAFT_1074585 [Trametes maxima]
MASDVQSQDPSDPSNPTELAQKLLEYIERQREISETWGPSGGFDDKLLSLLETTAATILRATPSVRNRHRPVNQLPLEILAKIFSYIPDPWDQEYASPLEVQFAAVDVRDLLPLALVCRSWRNIIIGTPSLWSSFIDRGRGGPPNLFWHNYANICSASTPIWLSIEGLPARETLDLLLQEGSRIGEIFADFSTLNRGRVGDLPVEFQSALLTGVERCFIRLNPRVERDEPKLLPILPVSRKLRTLHLMLPNFTPSTHFPALTVLTITEPQNVTLSHLLAFLAGTPRLEQLKLSNLASSSLFTYPRSGLLPKRAVPLKHLYHLQMSEEAPKGDTGPLDSELREKRFNYRHAFLSHVSYPPTCAVELLNIRASDVQPFLDLMAGEHCATRVRVSLDQDPSGRFWSSTIDARSGSAGNRALGVSFSVVEPFRRGPGGARRGLPSGLCNTMHNLFTSPYGFANVRKLWMHPGSLRLLLYSARHVEPGVSFLTGMPKLELLIIRRSPTVPSNLADVLGALRVRGDGAVPCPALKTLAIDCYLLDFVDGRPFYRRAPCTEVDYVRALALSRVQAGTPMVRLLLYAITGQTEVDRGTILRTNRNDNAGHIRLVAQGITQDQYVVELAQEWQAHDG